MAQAVGERAVVLTEAILAPVPASRQQQMEWFTVVVSERFSALLVGNSQQVESINHQSHPPSAKLSPLTSDTSLVNVKLTFAPEAIASFLGQLKDLFQPHSQASQTLERYCQILQPNDARLQGEFTLLLLELLLPQQNSNQILPSFSSYPYVSVCQPVENALKKQIAQERLLNQVTTQIRKSLDLRVIMATAVDQVREFLQLDRLVIYKFDDSQLNAQNSGLSNPTGYNGGSPRNGVASENSELKTHLQEWQQHSGCIVYEACARDSIPSVLNYREENCFMPNSSCWEKYCQGFTLVVDDVETTYALQECLLTFLRETQVRAKLAAPIVFQDQLWGLLIAHQCDSPRQWQDSEKNLLKQIAEQLAIAIHQAELMESLNQEKQSLEQRLIDCTIALHDALVAAQAASRVRSEFLATISHELRTPLTYVIGMSSTLLHWHMGEMSQRQRHYLQRIHDSGEHLLTLINDILDLSQLEAGKAVLNISEFSLGKLAETSVHSFSQKAEQQQVNLKIDLQIEPLYDTFTADEARVQQIIWNLLSNAVKFTPEGGDVILRLWVEDDTAVFQVEDTGIGIPENQLPLLFEKFQQLDTPYRRRYEGTGLGLALTKQLIELHRGRIEVESTVGAGSIFTVWIPAQLSLVVNPKS